MEPLQVLWTRQIKITMNMLQNLRNVSYGGGGGGGGGGLHPQVFWGGGGGGGGGGGAGALHPQVFSPPAPPPICHPNLRRDCE